MSNSFARVGALVLALTAVLPAVAGNAADDVVIGSPYVRAVPAVMQNSAMFVTLKNVGTVDHAVIAAASDAAEHVELHTHVMDGEVMRMRQVEKIGVRAGQTTVLEPGGLHVMLLGLKQPLQAGTTVRVDLTFDDGSTETVDAPVRDVQVVPGMHHSM